MKNKNFARGEGISFAEMVVRGGFMGGKNLTTSVEEVVAFVVVVVVKTRRWCY